MRQVLTLDDLEANEIDTLDKLIDYLLEEDSTAVMPGELQALSRINDVSIHDLIQQAKQAGLSIAMKADKR